MIKISINNLVVILYENRANCKKFEKAIDDIDLNICNSQGANILHYFASYAVEYNLSKSCFLEVLLSKGLNINTPETKGNGYTALHIAVLKKDIELCELLLDNGANIDAESASGNSPLFVAVMDYRGNDGGIITFLIEKGANINHCNKLGYSPLIMSETIANYDLGQFFK